ncbi:MAG: L,D-transpeptidase family protein [Alphaproteobacteria bacterium]|nr:L,D-transpeptidase family protein [Alphaproteobacteria bacterium]
MRVSINMVRAWLLAAMVMLLPVAAIWLAINIMPRAHYSIDERLVEFGDAARSRLLAHFLRAGVAYPPAKVVLVGLKAERQLQLYAAGQNGRLRFVRAYPVLAAAGGPGPKLREGDRQVPEGLYPIRYLNPNSAAYVSLMIGYPNRFDRARAREEGRRSLGGQIVIHGPTTGTAGCLAMRAPVVEELFTLAADAGVNNTRIVLSPRDFRRSKEPAAVMRSPWNRALYARIAGQLAKLPRPDG